MILDVGTLFDGNAKLDDVCDYLEQVNSADFSGKDVIITGKGPIWLYLIIAHHLHGIAMSLTYDSPVTGEVSIFDHNPF